MTELRPLTDNDLAAVQQLDLLCFEGDAFASGWWHKAVSGQGAFASVAWQDDRLLGYCLFSRVLDEAELLRIAIAPDARQRGLGARLLSHAETALRESGTAQLFLEVRLSNQPAQQLYRRAGWQQSGRRKDYYPLADGREDALIFSRTL
ncbi:ribosomal protein S18-alanine N-acetyltransferase [Marinobacterium sediminicola]|uniref:[Ribosomal protein bS18]-alanine N-acetyltransferase n=1 Tax=Marinobacterium sediminicola TaxID=518898 RepID=A0ABY1S0S5_9GAMM|nr:ribosomal protein S18-alanine N-acetyltransferase [Marinobacterium sediminicola]ULG69663.1 ribosomal protein S18-alanine N-acetyltransferase [Marinobacterium sediminicola]SMR74609.1 ribosomal-protein-alanine N-acetyltransferase [Marinobacterium sediminicola]